MRCQAFGQSAKRLTAPLLLLNSPKKQLIAANMTLTDREATKFWPVCQEYSSEADF